MSSVRIRPGSLQRISHRKLSVEKHFPHVSTGKFRELIENARDPLASILDAYHRLPLFAADLKLGFAQAINHDADYRADVLLLAIHLLKNENPQQWADVKCSRLDGIEINPSFVTKGKLVQLPGASSCLEVKLQEKFYLCTRTNLLSPDCYRTAVTQWDARPVKPAMSQVFLQIIDPHVRHEERVVWTERSSQKDPAKYFAEQVRYTLK